MRKAELRQPVYAKVEEIAGRKITGIEHDAIKALLIEMVNTETGWSVEKEQIMHRQGQKLGACKTALYRMAKSRGMADEHIAFLKDELVKP